MTSHAVDTAGTPPAVRLAHEIATQFRHRPAEQAAEEIAGHIRTFWEPRMRAALLAHVEAVVAEIDPLVTRVAGLLKTRP